MPPLRDQEENCAATAMMSCAASLFGERTSSGVCARIASRTLASRRMMPASSGW
jgi:hypothetical protein